MESYRSAHEIAARVGKDEASTEDLRVAMIKYRTLFDELAGDQVPGEIKAVALGGLRPAEGEAKC